MFRNRINKMIYMDNNNKNNIKAEQYYNHKN